MCGDNSTQRCRSDVVVFAGAFNVSDNGTFAADVPIAKEKVPGTVDQPALDHVAKAELGTLSATSPLAPAARSTDPNATSWLAGSPEPVGKLR